ncbi:HNH endonuclease signature motif containing protein [Brachybacterium huguangmaarense]
MSDEVGSTPPRGPRVPVTRDALPERAGSLDDPLLSLEHQVLWDENVADARRLAARMAHLAPFWRGRDAPGAEGVEDVEDADLRIALALRVTEFVAHRMIRDAHIATRHLPRSFERLVTGELPAAWMQRLLRAVSSLTPAQRASVDERVGRWSLAVTAEQFGRRVAEAVALVRSREALPEDRVPSALRRVEIFPVEHEEGMACLSILGPAPEISALGVRLDQAARAVQSRQRQALAAARAGGAPDRDAASAAGADGTDTPASVTAIPFDDGTVGASGRALSLARLRYDVITRSVLETGGVAVPEPRFRVNVTVPVTTLLGEGDEPGTLDGVSPIPAPLARELAGREDVWFRILTDPVSGAFLPLPASRYVPTPAMLEHLRLRGATCAVPGCTRPSSWASEADHIEEFDHLNPEAGGRTEIENLHLLCWAHHQDKTARRLDPTRLEHPAREPGGTRWEFPDGSRADVPDDTDLMSPEIAERLHEHWIVHERLERQRAAVERAEAQRRERRRRRDAEYEHAREQRRDEVIRDDGADRRAMGTWSSPGDPPWSSEPWRPPDGTRHGEDPDDHHDDDPFDYPPPF